MRNITFKSNSAKIIVSVIMAIFAMGTLTACAPVSKMDMTSVAAVIDVRTADEFASGHLDGAVNIDVQAADFGTKVEQLDKAAEYVVYCRSGNRSARAIEIMTGMGFTNLMDGGSVDSASQMTGLAVVQ